MLPSFWRRNVSSKFPKYLYDIKHFFLVCIGIFTGQGEVGGGEPRRKENSSISNGAIDIIINTINVRIQGNIFDVNNFPQPKYYNAGNNIDRDTTITSAITSVSSYQQENGRNHNETQSRYHALRQNRWVSRVRRHIARQVLGSCPTGGTSWAGPESAAQPNDASNEFRKRAGGGAG